MVESRWDLVVQVLRRLPPLAGEPITIGTARGLRDRNGPAHGGAFLRTRTILFDCTRAELPRIFAHELFHFVWLHAGNGTRRAFEDLLAREWHAGARGELGWSAELRKVKLTARDVRDRNRRWRDYCCESFCDTAAWLYGGVARHEEFTLARPFREARREYFRQFLETRALSI